VRGKKNKLTSFNVIVILITLLLFSSYFYFTTEVFDTSITLNNLLTGLAIGDVGIDAVGENINISTNTTINTSQIYNNVNIHNNSFLFINSSANSNATIVLDVVNLTIEAGSGIFADGAGYYGTNFTGNGPGGGGLDASGTTGGGGAHGGQGGDGNASGNQAGNNTYGSSLQPTALGSAGGGCFNQKFGSPGGGAIRFNISNELRLNGVIRANGFNGVVGTSNRVCGAGSGGSIYVLAYNISGAGNFTAVGGNGVVGASFTSGGGSGGRIAVYYNVSNLSNPENSNVSAGGIASGSNNRDRGEAGSLIFIDQDDKVITIYGGFGFYDGTGFNGFDVYNVTNITMIGATHVYSNLTNISFRLQHLILENSSWNVTNISLNITNRMRLNSSSLNGSTINITAPNLSIDVNSVISTIGLGYVGRAGGNGTGPGGGTAASNFSGGGGGYGGSGGNGAGAGGSSDGVGGITYGSNTNPTDAGSAGGGCFDTIVGSSGGGAIIINVTDSFKLDGKLYSEGKNGSIGTSARVCGAGAGGSIFINAYNLSGLGNYSSIGGFGVDQATYDAGAGGGGRIAIYYNFSSLNDWGNVTVQGGVGKGAGGNGSNGTFIFSDLAGPIPTILTPTNGSNSSGTNLVVPINWSYLESGNLSNCFYSLNGATNASISNCALNYTNVTAIDEARNNITVYLNDTSGNIGQERVNFIKDITAPFISITQPSNGSNLSGTLNRVINWTYTEGGIVVNCFYSLNDAANTSISSCTLGHINITAIDEARNNITVYVNDSAGNIGKNTSRFIVDITAPRVNITNPVNGSNQSGSSLTMPINWTYTEGGIVVNCFYSLNDAANTSISSCTLGHINITAIDEARNNITVYVNDSASNIGNYKINVIKDITAPQFNITTPTNFSNLSGSNLVVAVNWSYYEGRSITTCFYSLNGAANASISNCALNYTNVTAIDEARNNITVYLNDTSGNIRQNTISFVKDITAPTFNITFPTNESTISGDDLDISINWTYSEGRSIATCFYSLNGAANASISDCTLSYANVTVIRARNNITVYLNDTSGNMAQRGINFLTNNAPEIPTLSAPINGSTKLYNNITFSWNSSDSDVDSLTYNFEASFSTTFSGDVINFTNSSTNHTPINLTGGVLYFRVRTYDGISYSSFSDFKFVTLLKPIINITSPNNTQVVATGATISLAVNATNQSNWLKNVTIDVLGDGINETYFPSNISSDAWSYSYTVPSTLSPGNLTVIAYGRNSTNSTEQVNHSIILQVTRSVGGAVGAPEVNLSIDPLNLASNITKTNISVVADLDTTLSSIVTVVKTPNGTNETITSSSTLKTNLKYQYNYTYNATQGGTYLIQSTVTDINEQASARIITFNSNPPITVNYTMNSSNNLTIRDPLTGRQLARGPNVYATDLVPGKYLVDMKANDVSYVYLNNASLNSTYSSVLNFQDISETISPPTDIVAIDQVILTSPLSFDAGNVTFNYTSKNSSIHVESSLKVYKCDSVSSCTWSEISTASIDSTSNIVSAPITNFSVFMLAENVATVTTTSSGGAGGGGTSVESASIQLDMSSLELVLPGETLTIPVIIKNVGDSVLEDISFNTESDSGIDASLSKNHIDSLDVGHDEEVILTVQSGSDEGRYLVKILAEVGNPYLEDSAVLYLDVFTSQKQEEVQDIEDKIKFAKELFEENSECLELTELLTTAEKSLNDGDVEKANNYATSAIDECKGLVGITGGLIASLTEKPESITLILIGGGGFILLIIGLVLGRIQRKTRKNY